jgi:hypothetical protein
MYSRTHSVIAGLTGIPLVGVAPSTEPPLLLWAYILLLGVGIDGDHFVIARINRGDWTNLQRCLQKQSRVFVEQATIFDNGDIWRDQRLLSHLLIGGGPVTLLWLVNTYWAFGTAVTIYTHLLADLYSDIQTRTEYLRQNE